LRRLSRIQAATVFLVCISCPVAAGQGLSEELRARVEAAVSADSMEILDERVHARHALYRAYSGRGFEPYWLTQTGLSSSALRLVDWLQTEPQRQGLVAADYHLVPIERLLGLDDPGARIDLELALSDAFVMLASHLAAGRLDPETLDPEWRANREHVDIVPLLERAASAPEPGAELQSLLPEAGAYRQLVDRLMQLRTLAESGGWRRVDDGPTLREGDESDRVVQLGARLAVADGFTGTPARTFTGELAGSVRRFQRRHGLNADGVVGEATLAALNVPIETRMDQLVVNLERWRWLPETLGERYILVNIADFTLRVVDYDVQTLSMRVVVGRPYRRTPVFSGEMTYIVFNPYWEVPHSIAVEDKLPEIRKDPAYLEREGFTLLSGWGADERTIDPSSIDWNRVTPATFDFRLRQSPGPKNALGRVKFMFPNPFSVYLHDTPSRELFARESRTFSSGCIRLEKPLELARLLLDGDGAWTAERIRRVVSTGKETTVLLPVPVPVHLLYWTAWVDDDNVLQFRDDVYDRDKLLLSALRKQPPWTSIMENAP
jgi:murein L,D-transpeptidase YcbB/YkuD